MLFMAAAIEAFWSSSSVPDEIKRAIGGAALLAVLAYLALGGRAIGKDELEDAS